MSKPVMAALVKTFDKVQDRYNSRLESIADGKVSEDELHSFVAAHTRLRDCIEAGNPFYPEVLVKDIQRRIDEIVRQSPEVEKVVSVEELDELVELIRNMQKLRDINVAEHLCSEVGCEESVPVSLGAWLNLHIDLETMALVAQHLYCSACLEHVCESES